MSSQKSSLNNTSRITHEFCGTQKLGNVLGCFCFFSFCNLLLYIYCTDSIFNNIKQFLLHRGLFPEQLSILCIGRDKNPQRKLVCDYTIKYYITIQAQYKYKVAVNKIKFSSYISWHSGPLPYL